MKILSIPCVLIISGIRIVAPKRDLGIRNTQSKILLQVIFSEIKNEEYVEILTI